MRSFSFFFIATFIVFASSHHSVIASECPTVAMPEQINQDTQNCLSQLEASFPSYDLDTNLESERNYIIMENSRADQPVVIGVFFFKYCELVKEPRWNLTSDSQRQHLELARKKLYNQVPFAPPVIDSRTLTHFLSDPQMQFVTSFGYEDSQVQYANLRNIDEGISVQPVDHHVDEPDKSVNYLREVPFVVTDANKNFVMVSSVKSEQDALKEVKRLKRKAPQFDFVAYAPYRGNPNFAIMMATWVSDSVAKAALEDAKTFVNTDSIIWSCRDRGSYC